MKKEKEIIKNKKMKGNYRCEGFIFFYNTQLSQRKYKSHKNIYNNKISSFTLHPFQSHFHQFEIYFFLTDFPFFL